MKAAFPILNEPTLTLEDVADRLHFDGKDRVRSVRRLLDKHQIPFIQPTRRHILVLESQYALLMERLEL